MNKMLAIARYELLMQVRRTGFWILTIVALALLLMDTFPHNLNMRMEFFANHYYVAGKIFADGLNLLAIIMLFLVSDRVIRDSKSVAVYDVLMCTPVTKNQYLFGKFLGNLSAMLTIIFIISSLSIIPQILFHPTAFNFVPYAYAFIILGIPPVIFVTGISISFPSIFKNIKIFYLVFIIYWLYCFFVVPESYELPFYRIIGDARKLIYTPEGFHTPYQSAYMNIMFLIFSGLFAVILLMLLNIRKREREI